jgi:hypothetical protein
VNWASCPDKSTVLRPMASSERSWARGRPKNSRKNYEANSSLSFCTKAAHSPFVQGDDVVPPLVLGCLNVEELRGGIHVQHSGDPSPLPSDGALQ